MNGEHVLENGWRRGLQHEVAARVAVRREFAAHVVLGRPLGDWGERWAEGYQRAQRAQAENRGQK